MLLLLVTGWGGRCWLKLLLRLLLLGHRMAAVLLPPADSAVLGTGDWATGCRPSCQVVCAVGAAWGAAVVLKGGVVHATMLGSRTM